MFGAFTKQRMGLRGWLGVWRSFYGSLEWVWCEFFFVIGNIYSYILAAQAHFCSSDFFFSRTSRWELAAESGTASFTCATSRRYTVGMFFVGMWEFATWFARAPLTPPPSLLLSHLQLDADSLQGMLFFFFTLFLHDTLISRFVFKLRHFKYSLISEFSHSSNVLLSPSLLNPLLKGPFTKLAINHFALSLSFSPSLSLTLSLSPPVLHCNGRIYLWCQPLLQHWRL